MKSGLAILVAALLALACAGSPDPIPAGVPATAEAPHDDRPRPWLELEAPPEGAEITALLPWIEI